MNINGELYFSEKKDQILKAIMEAKRTMAPIKKELTNTFHKNKYAGLPAFIDATEDALDAVGVMVIQTVSPDFDKPVLILQVIHIESEQWVKTYAPLLNTKSDCQGLGSAITYMRRYLIGALFNLYAEDDDGQKACQKPEQQQQQAQQQQRNNNQQQRQQPQQRPPVQQQAASAPPAQQSPQKEAPKEPPKIIPHPDTQSFVTKYQLHLKSPYADFVNESCARIKWDWQKMVNFMIENESRFLDQFKTWQSQRTIS